MKRIFHIMVFVLFSGLFSSCQKELSFSSNSGNSNPGSVEATLQGNIFDENDQPAQGVAINVGSMTAITDSKGYFRIIKAALHHQASLVTAEKAGYFKAFRTFAATSGTNQVMIKLLKKTITGTVNASSGGDVTLANGSKITLPANGVVNASTGSVYSGTVNVNAVYIDPSSKDISQIVPGSFMANDRNNKRVLLSSYGMMAVELISGTGEKLQIKSGNKATLSMLIPSTSLVTAPNSIALWYVDEQTGIWKEEGSATKQGDYYIGEVNHFSFWNLDVPMEAVNLAMTLRNPSDLPLVHATVRITRPGPNPIQAYGVTDSIGQVSGLVPSYSNLVMDILDPCNNVIYSQNIAAPGESTNLGLITVSNSNSAFVTVQGSLRNCSNAAVSNGYAIIYYNNTVRYADVSSNGNFTVTLIKCSSLPNDVQVLGVDETTLQQGNTINTDLTAPITHTGNISACGNSATEYISYAIDGTSYTVSFSPTDSLASSTYPHPGTNTFITSIGGYNSPSNNIQFSFFHPAMAPGTYPLSSLDIQSYNSLLVQPFSINITNLPSMAGQFYEGNMSGHFKDLQFITHSLTANFRVRRIW